MNQITARPTLLATAELYTEVHQFHSRQLILLDNGLYDEESLVEWSRTLTENAEHWVDSMPAPTLGRDRILAAQKANPISADLVARGLLRRHLITNLVVEPHEDGSLASTYYVQIVDTPAGGASVVGTSTLVRELVVRVGTQLRTRTRKVSRDDLR